VYQKVRWLGPISARISGWRLRRSLVRARWGSGAAD
jgi:hypothetical protein